MLKEAPCTVDDTVSIPNFSASVKVATISYVLPNAAISILSSWLGILINQKIHAISSVRKVLICLFF